MIWAKKRRKILFCEHFGYFLYIVNYWPIRERNFSHSWWNLFQKTWISFQQLKTCGIFIPIITIFQKRKQSKFETSSGMIANLRLRFSWYRKHRFSWTYLKLVNPFRKSSIYNEIIQRNKFKKVLIENFSNVFLDFLWSKMLRSALGN